MENPPSEDGNRLNVKEEAHPDMGGSLGVVQNMERRWEVGKFIHTFQFLSTIGWGFMTSQDSSIMGAPMDSFPPVGSIDAWFPLLHIVHTPYC